jgi:hypothetical protein
MLVVGHRVGVAEQPELLVREAVSVGPGVVENQLVDHGPKSVIPALGLLSRSVRQGGSL